MSLANSVGLIGTWSSVPLSLDDDTSLIGKVMDTVNVRFARNGRPGEVKLIMPFLEDRIAGRFVYHCHILEHEDSGMMANINVLPRR